MADSQIRGNNAESIKALLEGYERFLNLRDNEFIIHHSATVFHVPEQLLENILTEVRNTGYRNFNVIDLITDQELKQKLLDFIYITVNKQEEEGRKKRLALAFPVFLTEDKKNYVASAIYPLEYNEINNELYITKLLPNCELLNAIKNIRGGEIIEKNKETSNDDKILRDIFELVLSIGSSVIPLPPPLGIAISIYTSRTLLKRIYLKYFKEAEEIEIEEDRELTLEDEKLAFIFCYDEFKDYTRNTRKDITHIKDELNSAEVRTKLQRLYGTYETILKDNEKAEILLQRRWSLFKNDLTESQEYNYTRILKQPIVAIEGPPGTGKTHLIATYCLDRLTECLWKSYNGETDITDNTVLVTSTNNKAVDNVLLKLKEFDEFARDRLITGEFIEGYARLGSNEIINIFKDEIERNFLSKSYTQEEIDKNKEKLSNLISQLYKDIVGYRKKQQEVIGLKEEISKIDDYKKQRRDYEEEYNQLVKEVFINSDKASLFYDDTLLTFKTLIYKLKRWYANIPFISSQVKKRFIAFSEEKGLNISGASDFKYLSSRELFERNIQVLENLKKIIEIRRRLKDIGHRLEELEKKRHYLEILKSELQSQEFACNQKRIDFLIRLKEYHYWNLQGDNGFRQKLLELRNTNPWRLYKEILRFSPIILSTSLSIRNTFPPYQDIFGTAIVDEGSQTLFCYTLPVFFRAKRFVVIGDKNQLEPVRDNIDDEKLVQHFANLPSHLHYTNSAIETVEEIDRTEPARRRLREHFRCQEPIIKFCDSLIGYGLIIKTREEKYQFRGELTTNLMSLFERNLVFIPIAGKSLERDKSRMNEAEADFIINKLIKPMSEVVDLKDLAILTPYRAQGNYIKQQLRKAGISVTVGTVHVLQGDEREIVILSTVCTSGEEFLRSPLLSNKKLINVAVSRAKKHLIVVGNSKAIEDINRPDFPLFALYRHIKDSGYIINESFA